MRAFSLIWLPLSATDEQFVLSVSDLFCPDPDGGTAFLILIVRQIIPDVGGQNIFRLTAAPNGRIPCAGRPLIQHQPDAHGAVLGVGQPVVYIKGL